MKLLEGTLYSMDAAGSYIASAVELPALYGLEGELVLVRVSVEARHLEELLDALAGLDFPVNPELNHQPGLVSVEFPAYATHVGEVRETITRLGFDPGSLAVHGMLSSAAVA